MTGLTLASLMMHVSNDDVSVSAFSYVFMLLHASLVAVSSIRHVNSSMGSQTVTRRSKGLGHVKAVYIWLYSAVLGYIRMTG